MVSRRSPHYRLYKPSLKTISIFLTRSDVGWWLILLNAPMMLFCPVAGLDSAEAEETAEPLPTERYVSGYLSRSYPIGGTLKFDGDKIPGTRFDETTGGGLKLGAFKSIWGAEFEVSGYQGTITAPRTVLGNTVRSAQLDTTVVNLMVNGLTRYPGDFIQPYAGIGIGLSILGMNGQTQSSAGIRELNGLLGFTLQGIIGIRLIVTNQFFGFAEYKPTLLFGVEGDGCGKYSKRNCRPQPIHSLNSQSHYVTAGIGFRF